MFSSTNNVLGTFGVVILLFLLLFSEIPCGLSFKTFLECLVLYPNKKKKKKERESNMELDCFFLFKTAGKRKNFALCAYPNK